MGTTPPFHSHPPRLRVMTYNVHSCKGRDGRIAPARTADIIAHYRPDIVALQEVRVGRVRPEEVDHPSIVVRGEIEPPVSAPVTEGNVVPPAPARTPGFVDQPGQIARLVGMTALFYPLLRMTDEDYGIAVLSRYPMRLIHAANLPTLAKRPLLERRGAIGVAVDVDGVEVRVVNTHLGLNRSERWEQVQALLGPHWARAFEPPTVLCGDLNAGPSQRTYRRVSEALADVQVRSERGTRNTWPSFFPLARIDHIFVPPDCPVHRVEVPRWRQVRVNSDHLPIVADIGIGGARS